jgi:Tfp pilus assembly protein PilO
MKKLSKEKRNQLVLVVMVTAMVVSGLWFGLIISQQRLIKTLEKGKVDAADKLARIEQTRKNEPTIQANLNQATNELARVEEDMASGDLYAWMLKTVGLLKLQHKVEITSVGSQDIKDVNLLPRFPYKQASYGIGGAAYFHDLGKFVADVENQYPYFRLVNLDISPEATVVAGDKEIRERLSFRMDIIALIKPGGF